MTHWLEKAGIAFGVIGGSIFLLLAIVSILFGFIPRLIWGPSEKDKWFQARSDECFEIGGTHNTLGDKTRCIHRDGRIVIKEWKGL